MARYRRFGAALPASDFERAKAWYAEKLGLRPAEDSPGGAAYDLGDGGFFLYPSPFAGTNQATAAGFEVDDLEATMAELREKGVIFEEYDLPGVKTEGGIADDGQAKVAWFKDSEGNILSMSQPLA